MRPYAPSVSQYLSFVAFAALVALAPGPDTFLTLRNTVVGGRGRGTWTAIGICLAGTVQGLLAAAGLGAVIAHAEPVFEAIRWAGVAYLVYLGSVAIRAALRRGEGWQVEGLRPRARRPWRELRSGFLSNITNPKVLMFNLAVLPQFVGAHASALTFAVYAMTLVALGAVVLLGVVLAADRAKGALQRSRVRRGVDGGTGVVMLGFAGALATEA